MHLGAPGIVFLEDRVLETGLLHHKVGKGPPFIDVDIEPLTGEIFIQGLPASQWQRE